jgi:hypothetical protein
MLQLIAELFNILADRLMSLISDDPDFPSTDEIKSHQRSDSQQQELATRFLSKPAPLKALPSNIWVDVFDQAFLEHFCDPKTGLLMESFGDVNQGPYLARFLEYNEDVKAGGKSTQFH